jgi:BirA family transcriptional regulator, biotin operon repressor / biotin---[acetyl-CoA-carboxylase] ligase
LVTTSTGVAASTGAAPATRAATATEWLARLEHFDVVDSTNDVVAGWLHEGTPEVCVAIAGEQLAGRGRSGRTWSAPAGASLLLSAGFRPTWLEPAQAWRLGAIVSLAMVEAAEAAARLERGTVRLKWPNDLVIVDGASGDSSDVGALKVAGVLGETQGLGTDQPQAVIGIGLNVDWARASFPAEFAAGMTSLSEAADGRSIGRDAVAEAFLERLAPLVDDLRAGSFPAADWRDRQLTNGLPVRLGWPDGTAETVTAVDVDTDSGALLVRPLGDTGPARPVLVGEIRHLRFGGAIRGGV